MSDADAKSEGHRARLRGLLPPRAGEAISAAVSRAQSTALSAAQAAGTRIKLRRSNDKTTAEPKPQQPSNNQASEQPSRAPKLPIPPALRKALNIVWALTTTFLGTLIFGALVLVAGIGSAWYAVHTGLPFNTYRAGPWVVWTHVGSLDNDPYSQARFAQMGALTTGSDRVVRFEARTDNDGRRLHSACTYELNSPPLSASYWTLGVFDTYGRLIPNDAQRYGFSTASVARDARGAFKISLSRDAKDGNWLPTGTAGRMVLLLEAVEGDDGGVDGSGISAIVPPTIRRTSC